MSSDRLELGLLKSIAAGLVIVAGPQDTSSSGEANGPAGSAIERIVGLTLDVQERSAKGFSQEVASEVIWLTKRLRENRDAYVRGVALDVMCGVVARAIINIFRGRSGEEANAGDLNELKRQIEEWFAKAAVTRRHLVPCTILLSRARAFECGPIRFFHASELDPKDYDVLVSESNLDVYFGPLWHMMQDHAACWLAEVSVDGCEQERSGEIAGLAVDIALGGLQLVVPVAYGRYMARITARTLPAYRGSFAVTDNGAESGLKKLQPGLGLSAEEFEPLMTSASRGLAAMGCLVDAYLSGQGDFPGLQQAWCNAIYWFHEGMSEPVDAVAIVKLETAIENLFRAESAKGSNARILDGLKGMFGIEQSDPISSSSDVTFKKFVEALVTNRSRVLHGTWPTLPGRDAGMSKSSLEDLARQFLIGYPQFLETYVKESDSPQDDARALLKWAVTRAGTDKSSGDSKTYR